MSLQNPHTKPKIKKSRFIPFDLADVESSVPARFELQVEKHANNIAIKEEHNTITYNELNIWANRLAHAILDKDENSETPIVILTDYGTPAINAMIAVLKAGKAYVIIDPTNPQDRIVGILRDSQSSVIVTDDKTKSVTESLLSQDNKDLKFEIINLDHVDSVFSNQNPSIEIPPEAYANIFFTSGSTGTPKGVINNHRKFLHSIQNATNTYKITPDDRLLLLTSLTFGASTSDIFGALLNGASVFPFPMKNRSFTQLKHWMITEKITMCHFVATSFRHFVNSLSGEKDFPDLRMIRLGGEAIYKHDVELYKEHFSDDCILRVGLASTEAGSFAWNFIDKNTDISTDIVPVGHPVEGFEILLLDDDHKPVEPDEVGEIAVRTRYMSPGYWRRPDLDKRKFIPDPEGGDQKICLTGDLGRFLPDGSLEHLTRKDSQVKIRGQRVEVSEIEAHLQAIEHIKDSAVIAQEDRFNEKRLVAYVVPSNQSQPSILTLRESLAEKLPDYMIPSTFVFLDSLPLTSSGKINRLKLPATPEGRLISGQVYVPPRNEIETQLVQIFEKNLEVQPVGVKDDFFELGGHSLTAIRIVSDIEELLSRSISIPEFVEALNVENLAKQLQEQDRHSTLHYVVGLRTTGTKPPLFIVPPSAATAMQAEKLAKYLGEDQPVYGFEYAGMDGKSEPFTSIKMMAQAFAQELHTVQPKGPYYLSGLCFGGVVAFEMAQQLDSQGEKVAFVGILDSNFPPRRRISLVYYYILTKQFIAKIRGGEYKIHVPDLERASKKFSDNDPLKKRFQRAFTTHHVARMGYASPPYPGVITKFTTSSPHAMRSTKGWGMAAAGGLEVIPIPGGHGARKKEGQTSFMAEPNIQVVAEKMGESLEKARKNVEGG